MADNGKKGGAPVGNFVSGVPVGKQNNKAVQQEEI